MEFIISRTSRWGREEKPCEEAIKSSDVYVDFRAVPTLEAAKITKWGKAFFGSGTNHREENGHVARDLEVASIWIVTIELLPDLLGFIFKYGKCVIKEIPYKNHPLEIEIYDDYRE